MANFKVRIIIRTLQYWAVGLHYCRWHSLFIHADVFNRKNYADAQWWRL